MEHNGDYFEIEVTNFQNDSILGSFNGKLTTDAVENEYVLVSGTFESFILP